ncbi:heterokaryon incompatibility protein-domain-containing protein, partial [Melanogaster broomeanus]
QYATLSHTWGDHEASYGEIASSVFDTKHSAGTFKVQNFCATVRKLGFRWAWCDTCCIDKSDSSELQETINSMFTWYRNSAITIVHLSDVSTSSQLKHSRWFRRGWTLQELLAPRAMQFYTSNWTIYRDRYYNHKHDYRLMGALQRITGIPLTSLVDFNPGVHDVREKMSWASNRTTTLIEDMTYSLAGLFDIALPICYGEGNKVFGRLQSEIIARTDDTSLFDWS